MPHKKAWLRRLLGVISWPGIGGQISYGWSNQNPPSNSDCTEPIEPHLLNQTQNRTPPRKQNPTPSTGEFIYLTEPPSLENKDGSHQAHLTELAGPPPPSGNWTEPTTEPIEPKPYPTESLIETERIKPNPPTPSNGKPSHPSTDSTEPTPPLTYRTTPPIFFFVDLNLSIHHPPTYPIQPKPHTETPQTEVPGKVCSSQTRSF